MSETRATYQAGEPDTIRELLRRWVEMEPERCKREDWPDGERILISTPYGWQLVMDDEEPTTFYPDKERAEIYIQYVAQLAITARGWAFDIRYKKQWDVLIDGGKFQGFATGKETVTEALLEAYLEMLEE
jgi:hypothetical protein